MKINSLLRTQQYLNNVGLLVILISSAFCISIGCGDAFFPSKMPVLAPSKVNKLVVLGEKEHRQIVKMDYDSVRDSLCLQINDYCLSFDEGNLGLVLNYNGTPHYRDIIDFRVHKDTPFKYVEQLFNKLRLLDKRLLLFRTNTIGEAGGTTGVKFLLPSVDPLYFASIEYQDIKMEYLPPPIYSKKYYWSLLLDTVKVPPLHVGVDERERLFYNKQQYLSQEDLFISLKKDLLDLKSREADICIWLDVDQDVSIQHFLATYVTIRNVYEDIWDESSLAHYGNKLQDLETKENQRSIRASFPFKLLWMSKGEYQFFKVLKERNQLNAFLVEHIEK